MSAWEGFRGPAIPGAPSPPGGRGSCAPGASGQSPPAVPRARSSFRAPRLPPPASRLPPGIEVDDPFDRAAARGAEGNIVAGEHDAVELRPVIALRLVHRSFEGTDPAGVFLGRKHPCLLFLLLEKEGIHGFFGAMLGSDLPALLMNHTGTSHE